MTLRKITAEDLATLDWIGIHSVELEKIGWTDTGTSWWRIVAEIICSSCARYQAADSDPTNDKEVATTLAVALFNDAGWRVDEPAGVLCRDCAPQYGVGA